MAVFPLNDIFLRHAVLVIVMLALVNSIHVSRCGYGGCGGLTVPWLLTRVTGYTGHVTRCLATPPPRVQQESVAGNLQQNSAGICAPSDEIVTNYNFYYVSFYTQSQVAGYRYRLYR